MDQTSWATSPTLSARALFLGSIRRVLGIADVSHARSTRTVASMFHHRYDLGKPSRGASQSSLLS